MSTFVNKNTKTRFTVSDDKDFRYEGGELGHVYDKVEGSGGVKSVSGMPDSPHTPFPPIAEA